MINISENIEKYIAKLDNPKKYYLGNDYDHFSKLVKKIVKVSNNAIKNNDRQDLTDYLEKNSEKVIQLLKGKFERNIKEKIKSFDWDGYISKLKDNDKQTEDLIYKGINDTIRKIFNKIKIFSKISEVKEIVPELFETIYKKFEKYLETATCERKEIENKLVAYIPKDIINLYPKARKKIRHFTIVSGLTNSGKTYTSMQELKKAKDGIYLAPLRLLAYEKYLELTQEGYKASLLTGEEEIMTEGATIQCSTVEMCNLNKEYDCIVLDETQKLIDEDRGCYWTKVILGSVCQNIIICCAPDKKDLIIKLIEKCGDKYDVIDKERLVPLQQTGEFDYNDVRNGDAYIVFSRRNVHALASDLAKYSKKKVSILYGNLPYDVRQEEARKFNAGETDILVSTDVIGMGLNLPIKRVILMETDKFDGKIRRDLRKSELMQIIGRAGRYGKYDIGEYTSQDNRTVKSILNRKDDEGNIPYIDMPKELLSIEMPIKNILDAWQKYPIDGYKKANTDNMYRLCEYAEKYITDKQLLWDLINIKFDLGNEHYDSSSFTEWKKIVKCLNKNEEYKYYYDRKKNTLEELEEEYKVYDMLYAYFKMTGDVDSKNETIKIRNEISKKIMEEVKRKGYSNEKLKKKIKK